MCPRVPSKQKEHHSGVLSKKEIIAILNRKNLQERLVITPLLDESQIDNGAVDIRISTEFITTHRSAFAGLDIRNDYEFRKDAGKYQTKHRVDFGNAFVLHPNELILGSTFEYICIPRDIFAYVLSRSSWGRLGLVIATATAVNPGYKGCLTLEMVNLGEVPLVLYPGLPVAQLILHKSGVGEYSGGYKYPTGPEPTNVCSESKIPEIEFWTTKCNPEPN